jgi:phosphoribosyl-ATP pyrophosphohydrolase
MDHQEKLALAISVKYLSNSDKTIDQRVKKIGEEFAELMQAIGSGNPTAITEEAEDLSFTLLTLLRSIGLLSIDQTRHTSDLSFLALKAARRFEDRTKNGYYD